MPAGAVYVGRPTKWGNPFVIGATRPHPIEHLGTVTVRDAHHATLLFREWLSATAAGQAVTRAARDELRGRDLACWCPPDQDCHADVLLAVANGTGPPGPPGRAA
jgi:hypothetical protein